MWFIKFNPRFFIFGFLFFLPQGQKKEKEKKKKKTHKGGFVHSRLIKNFKKI